MGPEEEKKPGIPNDLEELERLFAQREEKLSNGMRKHVRDLKTQGRFEEAMKIAQQAREKKVQTRQEKAEEELNRTILKLLKTDNSQEEGKLEIRAIWLLEAAEVIFPEERTQELIRALDSKAPELRATLEDQLAKIRDEVKPLMPPAEPPRITRKYRH